MGLKVLKQVGKGVRKAGTAVKSTPKAGKQFAKTLVSEGRKDLSRKGSSAQRFADAPLGQYYLPKGAQTALGFLAPSPRKVGRDTRNVIRNPSPGNVAAAGGNVLSIATLPLMGAGAVKGAKFASRAGKIGAAAKGLSLTERIGLAARGAATKDALFHGTTRNAAKAIRAGGFKQGETFVTNSPRVAARYARTSNLLEGGGKRGSVVVTQAKAAAKPLMQRPLSMSGKKAFERSYKAGDLIPKGERGLLKFPNRGSAISRIKARVMNTLSGETERTQYLRERISAVQDEIRRIDAGEALHKGSPTSLKNLSDIRSKVGIPKGKALPRALRGGEEGALGKGSREKIAAAMKAGETSPTKLARAAGVSVNRAQQLRTDIGLKTKKSIAQRLAREAMRGEEGFMRLPGGGEGKNKAAREVVRRANLKATRSALKETIGDIKRDLSLETNTGIEAATKGLHVSMQGRSPQVQKMFTNLAKREKRTRNVLKGIGVQAGRVERQQGSFIEIEGRLPLKGELQRAAQGGDKFFGSMVKGHLSEDVQKLKRLKVHPGRMPRN